MAMTGPDDMAKLLPDPIFSARRASGALRSAFFFFGTSATLLAKGSGDPTGTALATFRGGITSTHLTTGGDADGAVGASGGGGGGGSPMSASSSCDSSNLSVIGSPAMSRTARGGVHSPLGLFSDHGGCI